MSFTNFRSCTIWISALQVICFCSWIMNYEFLSFLKTWLYYTWQFDKISTFGIFYVCSLFKLFFFTSDRLERPSPETALKFRANCTDFVLLKRMSPGSLPGWYSLMAWLQANSKRLTKIRLQHLHVYTGNINHVKQN